MGFAARRALRRPAPGAVAAYLGTAQIGDAAAAESASYACALAAAERRGHRRALKALRAIGRPPYPASSVFSERTWLQRLDGQLSPRSLWNLRGAVFGGRPESSPLDLVNQIRGFRFTMDAMWREVSALNLRTAVPALRMPVVFFVGRRDQWVPPETTVAYFDMLDAPSKQLLWFDESGHEPFVDEPVAFNRAVVDTVGALITP